MSTVGVPAETAEGEHRVALVPQSVGKLQESGWDVLVESGAGDAAGFPNEDYVAAGATIVDRAAAWGADVVLGVAPPLPKQIAAMKPGATIAGFLDPYIDIGLMRSVADAGLTAIAMEAIPRRAAR